MSEARLAVAWREHEQAQRRLRLQSTYTQRLEWLEQAIEFVHTVRQARGLPVEGGSSQPAENERAQPG